MSSRNSCFLSKSCNSIFRFNNNFQSSAERIIGMVPDVVNKVGDIVNKFNGDKKENKDDSVFAEE